MDTGVRSAFFASAKAAEMMIAKRRGLIVNISFWSAQKYLGNTIYGTAKAATDKMSSDMAHELRQYGVTVVSLYPGLVRTEAVMAAAQGGWLDLSNSESPEFIGKVIAALNSDPQLFERLRQLRTELAEEEGVAAFVIFHDRTLKAIAGYKPVTPAALMEIPGIGALKAERYGRRVLEVVNETL